MSIHNRQLTRFVEKCKDRVEESLFHDEKEGLKPSDTGSITDCLNSHTLGNSNLMLSNLNQL